jgi:hypothetical protein
MLKNTTQSDVIVEVPFDTIYLQDLLIESYTSFFWTHNMPHIL